MSFGRRTRAEVSFCSRMSLVPSGFPWIRNDRTRSFAAFSLIELLVVCAVLGILASLLWPALHTATSKAQSVYCLGNSRQLTLGWLMYAEEEQGWLCPNGPGPKREWVEGVMDFGSGSTDNTNTLYLADPQFAKLAAYVKNPSVYHCSADRSVVPMNHQRLPRVRSVAMSEAVGKDAVFLTPANTAWRVYHKQSELTSPSPSDLWVFIEQHPDSIDDGIFAVDCGSQNNWAQWIDFPAYAHNRSSSLGFADGHAELRAWLAADSTPPVRYCGCLSHYASHGNYTHAPNSPDLAWLQARTSSKRTY
jgi:prepilin-type N-terminal cleavage/methylation domain-containing protein/prepilin-type processing-associated H-X9-DG protein